MIEIKTLQVAGFKGAILGMRNPYKNRDKSDSEFDDVSDGLCYIGSKDRELAQKLIRAGGDDDAKFMRMIHVQADVWAPLYWWKEFDTYKVATVANSESTMHTIHKREFTLDDFSCEYLSNNALHKFSEIVGMLNDTMERYLKAIERKDQEVHKIWYQLIQLLPSSYMQKRTIDLNYQTLRRIYFTRRNHKLNEWHKFCDWIKDLPYAKELITYDSSNATVGGSDASN